MLQKETRYGNYGNKTAMRYHMIFIWMTMNNTELHQKCVIWHSLIMIFVFDYFADPLLVIFFIGVCLIGMLMAGGIIYFILFYDKNTKPNEVPVEIKTEIPREERNLE